ncbi:hypothetical protein [Winogradskyella bathintestinalis]|uniref:Uncharacterized protein n=1 Tax=Winogradskyella bathintestinalis TaxID=3035208 RepID=A0ABT7ZYR0_9FLAO|nr:hypothetical protein [Winogradskyella bathintestinalis]MDN3494133.1 hypothetical protein [Winogradskyella bathintestinalis]
MSLRDTLLAQRIYILRGELFITSLIVSDFNISKVAQLALIDKEDLDFYFLKFQLKLYTIQSRL